MSTFYFVQLHILSTWFLMSTPYFFIAVYVSITMELSENMV